MRVSPDQGRCRRPQVSTVAFGRWRYPMGRGGRRRPSTKYASGPTKLTKDTATHSLRGPFNSSGLRRRRSASAAPSRANCTAAPAMSAARDRGERSRHRRDLVAAIPSSLAPDRPPRLPLSPRPTVGRPTVEGVLTPAVDAQPRRDRRSAPCPQRSPIPTVVVVRPSGSARAPGSESTTCRDHRPSCSPQGAPVLLSSRSTS
jgi:hypothetical protein